VRIMAQGDDAKILEVIIEDLSKMMA
jgi:hypothetical protein